MIQEVKELSRNEKLVLVQELWNEILSESADIPLTEEQRQALDEAEKDVEKNPEDGSSWGEVKERLEKKL